MLNNGIKLNEADCHLNLRVANNGYSANTLNTQTFKDLDLLWAGVRSTLGVHTGNVAFEVQIVSLSQGGHVRVGFSTASSSLHLGQDASSFGYQNNSTLVHSGKREPYGETFAQGDIIGCFYSSHQRVIGFAKNGRPLGTAVSVPEDLRHSAFFAHVSLQCAFVSLNFGQVERPPFHSTLASFNFINRTPMQNVVAGPEFDPAQQRSLTLLVGLPYSGKTTWYKKMAKENFSENPLAVSMEEVLEQMDIGSLQQRKQCAPDELKEKLEKATTLVQALTLLSSRSRRHLVLESNSSIDEKGRRGILKNFEGFEKRAVVFLPTPTVIQQRSYTVSLQEGKSVPPEFVLDQQERLTLPTDKEGFSSVMYPDCRDPDQMVLRYKITAKEIRQGLRSPPTQVFRVKTNLAPNRSSSFEDIRQTLSFAANSENAPSQHTGKPLNAHAPSFALPSKFSASQPVRARNSPSQYRYEPYVARSVANNSSLPSPMDLARLHFNSENHNQSFASQESTYYNTKNTYENAAVQAPAPAALPTFPAQNNFQFSAGPSYGSSFSGFGNYEAMQPRIGFGNGYAFYPSSQSNTFHQPQMQYAVNY